MTYNETDLKNKVIEETKNLLVHATAEERGRLDFESLATHNTLNCIYGQMAISCYSPRATHLLNRCTFPYSSNIVSSIDTDNDIDGPKNTHFIIGEQRGGLAYSPIEFYITTPNAQNATLIAFLRGERETLTVDDL